MAKVLIVDDSPVDRRLAAKLLEKRDDGGDPTGFTIATAENGRQALEAIARDTPDVVVTDLQMPEMNGLDLVLQIRARFPLVPVILMTAHGSEELAVRALKSGAASYVPKRDMAQDLLETVEMVIEAAHGQRDQSRLLRSLTRTESHFVLENDPHIRKRWIYTKRLFSTICIISFGTISAWMRSSRFTRHMNLRPPPGSVPILSA